MKIRKKLAACGRWVESRFADRSAILLYHRVAEKEGDHFNLCVSPSHFDEQMAAVSRIGTPVSLTEFLGRRRAGTLPPRSICVTFDDAYVDVMENALPVLERYGIPATIYVVTGNMGTPFWWDRLADMILRAGRLPDRIELGTNGSTFGIETSGLPRRKVMGQIYPYFRKLDPEVRRAQLSTLSELTGQNFEFTERRPMTADELGTIARHPLITLGAHTVTHSQLSSLSPEAQRVEIESSKMQLEEILEKPVDSLSYPFGLWSRDFTGETMEAAKAAGFDHAIAADLSVVTPKSDCFALPRLWVHDWDEAGFSRNMNLWL